MLDLNMAALKELRLHWNQIMARGGIMLAKALNVNTKLRVLDLSWNSCGSGGVTPTEVGTVWGNSLAENKTLLHLDLSFNKIKYADTQVLADKIKKNHTIYGLHYQGNEGRVDSLGFIRPRISKQNSPRE